MTRYLLLLAFGLSTLSITAQVNIWGLPTSVDDLTNPPDPSAMFHVSSTDKGMLVPRMTTTQMMAISSPANALLVYNTTFNSFYYFDGSSWKNLSAPTTLQDDDSDTSINTDDGSDNDEIIYKIKNTEVLKLDYNLSSQSFGIRPASLDGNTFLGNKAGIANISNAGLSQGIRNTFIGSFAGESNTDGWSNTLVGTWAGSEITTGSYNHIFGVVAGIKLSTGDFNCIVGGGHDLETGNKNTYFGHAAGYSNVSGDNNVFLGYQAGYSELGSSKLYIDYSNTSSPLIYGDFATDELRINGSLQVNDPATTGYPFPMTDGTANQILETDGSGTLSWVNNSSSSGIDHYNIPYTEFYCTTGAGVYKPLTPMPPYSTVFATIANPDPTIENALTAPLRLKDGATINEIAFDFIDNDAAEDLTFGIISQDLSTGTISILGSTDSGPPSTSLQTLTIMGTSLSSNIIDNNNKAYFIYCVPTNDPFGGWTAFQIGISSVSIEYQ